MGYNGMGYQRWIATMKPRKFLGKRSKPDGGGGESVLKRDIRDYYHLNKGNNLLNVRKRAYPEGFKRKLNHDQEYENQKQVQFKFISLLISIVVVFLIFWYLNTKLGWF
jgi:hypothetical protein